MRKIRKKVRKGWENSPPKPNTYSDNLINVLLRSHSVSDDRRRLVLKHDDGKREFAARKHVFGWWEGQLRGGRAGLGGFRWQKGVEKEEKTKTNKQTNKQKLDFTK